jgi:hypothetical protein
VIDRLRILLDRPVDPAAARAVLVLSAAVFLGFAAVLILAAGESGEGSSTPPPARHQLDPAAASLRPEAAPPQSPPRREQDPQDHAGTAAARNAGRELRNHAALQHVPYRVGELAIVLAGAHKGKAILNIFAATRRDAVRGWRAFLAQFDDTGRAYLPRFSIRRGPRG